jgi:DNA-binding protein HU-beta
MNKKELITAAATKSGLTQREIEQSVEPFLKCVLEALEKGETIVIQKFGTFSVKEWNGRKLRNINTGESLLVPPKKVVKFKVTPMTSLNKNRK